MKRKACIKCAKIIITGFPILSIKYFCTILYRYYVYTHIYVLYHILVLHVCIYKGRGSTVLFSPLFLSFARKHPSLMFWLPLT